MNQAVDAIERRLRQAGKHLHALNQSVERFLGKPKPYTLSVKFDPRRSRVVVRAVDVKPLPSEWDILIGECVYQLRASLDNLAYALAVRNTVPLPKEMAENVAFPIRYSGPKFRRAAAPKLAAVDRRAAAVIETLQPYHRRKKPAAFVLRQLEELRNVDQHRLLHPAALTREASRYRLDFIPGQLTRTDNYRFINGPLKENAMLAWFEVIAHVPKPDVYVDDDAAIDVAFEQGSPARKVQGQSVIATLSQISAYIRGEVLPQLYPFLA